MQCASFLSQVIRENLLLKWNYREISDFDGQVYLEFIVIKCCR
jgi:hypothetical protein